MNKKDYYKKNKDILSNKTGRQSMPLVTKCFPPNPYLGKQRISPGVTTILSMCLCSHT